MTLHDRPDLSREGAQELARILLGVRTGHAWRRECGDEVDMLIGVRLALIEAVVDHALEVEVVEGGGRERGRVRQGLGGGNASIGCKAAGVAA